MNKAEKENNEFVEELADLRRKAGRVEDLERERERMSALLTESEERYWMLVYNARDSVIVAQDEVIKFSNPYTAELTAYSPEELKEMPLSRFIHSDDMEMFLSQCREKQDGIANQSQSAFSFRGIRKGGAALHLEANTALMSWEGKPAVLFLVRDITEQLKMESQLRYAKKMEAIGTLAGGIAHDFNNHLQAISGYVQLLLMKQNLDDSIQRFLNQMDKSVQRSAALTKQLLIFSRKEEIKLKLLELNKVILQSRDLLKKTVTESIDIEFRLSDDLDRINGDPVQLEQVMVQMGIHARDAMSEGGRLIVETRNILLDERFCSVHSRVTPGRYVEWKISDTGHGRDDLTGECIFEPCRPTKGVGVGAGLGLAAVYGIVQGHRGYMTCESRLARGTTFRIYLPAAEPAGKQMAELDKKAVVRGGKENILLVDDEESVMETATSILSQFGYRTFSAKSGEEALEVYKKTGHEISLIILDLGMPGMGGESCMKEILKMNPKARIIVASGYATSRTARSVMDAGAIGFVAKPYRMEDMLKKIREAHDA
jgi:two-component system, cell cycle sensor histidine kinase and response regulator CckA